MFHLWYTRIKGFSGMFSPRSHVWPLPLPHSLPNPQPRPALLKKDQGLPTWDSWHLPACCFTFASVCYKWICWTLKHLAETTSKFSQDPFTAPFFWETAVLKWSWVLVGLKGSEQTVRAGRQAGWAEWGTGRETPPTALWVFWAALPSSAPCAYSVLLDFPHFSVSPFHFPERIRSQRWWWRSWAWQWWRGWCHHLLGQHIVVERALAVETGLNSNPSSFPSQLLRSANGFTFLSLCLFICKVGAIMPVSQDLARGPSDTAYLKAASVLAGLQ